MHSGAMRSTGGIGTAQTFTEATDSSRLCPAAPIGKGDVGTRRRTYLVSPVRKAELEDLAARSSAAHTAWAARVEVSGLAGTVDDGPSVSEVQRLERRRKGTGDDASLAEAELLLLSDRLHTAAEQLCPFARFD